jgi:putative transcriptional regulator
MPDPARGLAPGFLVAAPALADPNFAGSLVLMAEHQGEGSLGFVVNRPSPIGVAEVLGGIDPALRRAAEAAGRAEGQVLVGGPVSPERLWILHRPGVAPAEDGDLRVGDRMALGGSRALLEVLARDPGGGPFLLLLGYAGWAAMQIEREIGAGAWVPLDLADDLVFGVPFEDRWDEAVRRLGLDPGGFLMGRGGAQA